MSENGQGGYRVVYRGAQGSVTEKKSRFIACVSPARDEAEAASFINSIKKKHPDARHNCSAYRIGTDPVLTRSSDDGEPSGTAGRPMLEMLAAEDLHDVCAVVTRYFGGTLLGTGGLVRAYTAALREALSGCVIVNKTAGTVFDVRSDYGDAERICRLVRASGLLEPRMTYAQDVRMEIIVPARMEASFNEKVTDITNGRAAAEKRRDVWFADVDGKAVIF